MSDRRQRAVVKLHYFAHVGGGAAALRAHARYIGREAARERDPARDASKTDGKEQRAASAPFYSADLDRVDGANVVAQWARSDRRHFRIILAAENAAELGRLREYTREVMRRAEAALGSRLDWIAIDHWNTDNPHTHIVLRGVTKDGRELIIPREYVQHGFRTAARDAATERLGPRTARHARKALEREARAHRPTRLDTSLASQLDDERRVRVASLRAPYGGPHADSALRERARVLKAMGFARDAGHGVLLFTPGWREALTALELHLDIRKALMRARSLANVKAISAAPKLGSLLGRPRGPGRGSD